MFCFLNCSAALLKLIIVLLAYRHLVSIHGMGAYQNSTWEDVCSSLYLVEEYAGTEMNGARSTFVSKMVTVLLH